MRSIWYLFVLSVLLVACGSDDPSSDDSGVDLESVEASDDGTKVVMETDEGEVVVEGNDGTGGWCDEGADWSWLAQDSSASVEVIGIKDSGEFEGLCHIHYESQGPEGDTLMDYYISEDEETGFVEMTMPDGQKFKQEWTA